MKSKVLEIFWMIMNQYKHTYEKSISNIEKDLMEEPPLKLKNPVDYPNKMTNKAPCNHRTPPKI
jgi:hypothetical protein